MFCNFAEDIPKSPNEPAPIAKESHLIEDEAPWRRPTTIRVNRNAQHDSPPKLRKNHRISLLPTNFDRKCQMMFKLIDFTFISPCRSF